MSPEFKNKNDEQINLILYGLAILLVEEIDIYNVFQVEDFKRVVLQLNKLSLELTNKWYNQEHEGLNGTSEKS